MPIPLYLAMTVPEISGAAKLPEHLAYMACHFSLYSAGLSNLPQQLPNGSMLILNDATPPSEQDPGFIGNQLRELSEKLQCSSILLDFQRPDHPLTLQIVKEILKSVSCPVIVSDVYAQTLSCPVFVSALPCDRCLKDHIRPWQGREIWLEASRDGRIITVDKAGSRQSVCNPGDTCLLPHREQKLHCHYRIEPEQTQVRFTLQRTEEDLKALLQEAEDLGVSGAVGLYQELGLT